jgi:hypothetical protein
MSALREWFRSRERVRSRAAAVREQIPGPTRPGIPKTRDELSR